VRRIHRTFWERFVYLAIYQCSLCERVQHVPRPFRLHFGPHARCPHCGTFRLARLAEPDAVDPMQDGLWNLYARLSHGNLYHCRFCRLQFYDRRPAASQTSAREAVARNTSP
jgi:hypothetical protein